MSRKDANWRPTVRNAKERNRIIYELWKLHRLSFPQIGRLMRLRSESVVVAIRLHELSVSAQDPDLCEGSSRKISEPGQG
jgi:hypothetical protein